MPKLTKTPEGRIVPFSTMHGRPDLCSATCSGVYRFKGDLMCAHFHEDAYKRCKACINNEIKERKALNMDLPNSTIPPKKKKSVYATEAQKDYINDMLNEIDEDLSTYTDTAPECLTIQEASDVIDELKDAVDDYRHDND